MVAGMQRRPKAARAAVLLGIAAVVASVLAGSGETSRVVQGRANGRIAIAADAGMALVNPDGTGMWGMSELLPGDADPTWAPDGTRLAVASHFQTLSGIRVVDATGKTQSMLTSNGADSSPTWSPDGSEVAFIEQGQIWIVGVGASSPRKVTNDTLWRSHISWSADGKTIVAAAHDPSQCCDDDIYAYDLTDGTQTDLTPGGPNEQWPVVSPDGTHVAFTACCERGSQISVMRIDGTDVQRLTSDSWDTNPTWSPDGNLLAFVRSGSVWSMPAAGGVATQLNASITNVYGGLAWQPLGQAPSGACSLWGTSAPDLIVGTDSADTICGGGGNDVLVGLGGDDTISGGDGNDLIAGGQGRDILVGGVGADRLDGRDGAPDQIDGGAGRDVALVDPTGDRLRRTESRRPSWNIAAWHSVTASNSNATGPAAAAVDGSIEDWWNSGNYPAQWIEIDLGRPVAIGRIRLIAQDQPSQNPILVLGRGPDTQGTYRQLTRFTAPTVEKQELVRSPRKPWQRIRYLRIVVGAGQWPQGWVSWREIEVFPPGH